MVDLNHSTDSEIELNNENGDKGFNPQWNLLVNNNLDRSKSSKEDSKLSGSLNDEGDVGSTRQNMIKRRASKKVKKYDQLVDVKNNWVKVTYGMTTKRIYSAPDDIDTLKIAMWQRFGSIRDRV